MPPFFTRLARFALPLMLASGLAQAQSGSTPTSSQTIAHASQVAQSWLVDIDGDQYGKSWDKTASVFQNQISKQQWDVQMIRIRGLLGAATKRKLISANLRHQLPGMPDGEYVVLLYQTTFEHKAQGSETITPMRDKDGKWKVAGYLIR